MATDPVCGMKIDDNNAQSKTQYQGQTYNFCSDDCRKKFEKNPEQYAKRSAA